MRIHRSDYPTGRGEDVWTIGLVETWEDGSEEVVEEIDVVLFVNESPEDYPTWDSLPEFIREDYVTPDRILWARPTLVWF